MSDLVARLADAREVVNDPAVHDEEERLGAVSQAIGDALEELEGKPGKPELAKVIRVERGGANVSLTIDGRAFPWYVHEGGVAIGHIRTDDAPRVLVPIVAERVEVIDALDPVAPGVKYETTGGDTVRVEPEERERREIVGDRVEEPGSYEESGGNR